VCTVDGVLSTMPKNRGDDCRASVLPNSELLRYLCLLRRQRDPVIDGMLSFHQTCPIIQGGRFDPVACPAHTLLHPPDTSSSMYCHEPQQFLGSFQPGPIGRGPGTLDALFHSLEGCLIHPYTSGTMLGCATEALGTRRIIIAGDSLSRQLFVRLLSLLRHHTESFDFGKHASVR
jgi:hypothetical protein